MKDKSKKRTLYSILGALAVVVLIAFIVPSFIDANQYKDTIAEKVQAATGRTLAIEGNIDLAILPAPTLSVYQIRLANLERATSPDMVQLAALRVRIALFPLFSGRVQVESILLIDPIIELEILADGRPNWEFTSQKEENATPSEGGAQEKISDTDSQAIQVERFSIENGTIVYRDTKSGTLERIERLNADIRAESLTGPFRVQGDLVARGMPVSLNVGSGRFVEGPGTPVNFEVEFEEADTTLEFSGTLSAPNPTGVLTGKLTAKSEDLVTLIAGVGVENGKKALPGFLAQEFSYESLIVGSSTGIELREIAFTLGDTIANGGVKAKLGKTVDAEINVQVSKIDLDHWLAMNAKNVREKKESKASTAIESDKATAVKGKNAFTLPKDLNLSFSFAANSIIFQGAEIREGRIHASLANGELALDQATVQLPGGASLSLFGFVSATEETPRFDGDLDFHTENLRSLLNWLRVDIASIPADRMRKFSLKSKVMASQETASLKKVNLKLDESQVAGELSVALVDRPSFRGNLSMNRLNLDAYLKGEKKKRRSDTSSPSQSSGRDGKGEKNASEGLDVLNSFDADLSFKLDRLTFQKQTISGIRFDGALNKGKLSVREASIRDLSGSSLKASGVASEFTDTPKLDAQFSLRSEDVGQLLRLAAGASPAPALTKLGATTLNVRLVGGLDRLDLRAELSAAKGAVRADGEIGNLPDAPNFNLRVTAEHSNLASLLQTFDYRPQSSRLGGLNLQTQLKGTNTAFDLSKLDGRIGPVKLTGNLEVKLEGAHPAITAKFNTGEIPLHRFLPAGKDSKPSAARQKGQPASGRSSGGNECWSKEALDLSGLRLVDAKVDLSVAALIYDNVRVERPRLTIALKSGILELSKLSGSLFGGSFDAKARVTDSTPAVLGGTLTVRNANIRKALFASSGFDLGDGNLDFDLKLNASGNSPHELIAALNGNANVLVKDGVARGFDFDAVSARLKKLDSPEAFLGVLDTALSGGETRFQDLRGAIRVTKGVAQMENMRMQAQSGSADISGNVDFPRWRMDLRTDFRLASEPEAPVFAMLFTGPLDNPRRRFDTKQFQRHLIKKGIGSLLKKVRPLKIPESGAPAEKEGEKTSPIPEPEKIIQDILKGFGL